MALDVAEHAQQDLDGFIVRFGRAVDELGDDCFALADLAAPAVLGDNDELVNALFNRVFRFLAPGGRPRGLPDWPLTNWLRRGGLP